MTTSISDAGLQFADGNTQPYPIASVRQTVQSGPVDSNGFSAFGGSTGSTTVTATGTIIPTSANGTTNRTGSITNPSWTGLSTNGTMYLYVDVAANNTCTTGSTTLAPTYQWGGTYSTTNLQNTFNIQEMTMKVGNGSTAAQVYRVFVGEVTVAGGVTTAIVWYQLNGKYTSPAVTPLPGSSVATSKNTNLGFYSTKQPTITLICLTTDLNYAVGDRVYNAGQNDGGGFIGPLSLWAARTTAGFTTTRSGQWAVSNKTTPSAGVNYLTPANWSYTLTHERDF